MKILAFTLDYFLRKTNDKIVRKFQNACVQEYLLSQKLNKDTPL